MRKALKLSPPAGRRRRLRMLQLSTRSRGEEFPRGSNDSTFELWERIDPVAILYGSGGRLFVSEYNHSRRLLKELWRLGKERIRVRGMISTLGALDRSSVRALNCYLEHCYATNSWRYMASGNTHRHAWYDLQRAVALRWVR